MDSKNLPNNLNDMNVLVVIDKEKLPEDIRKILDEKLPKDVKQLKLSQEELFEMLAHQYAKIDNSHQNISDANKLFAIQTGTVVGNIYTGTYNKEEANKLKK